MATFGKPDFSPYGEPPGAILHRQDFFVNFEHMVLIFFWNYIQIAIDWCNNIWLYLGTLIFHSMGSPQECFFTPRGLSTAVLWLPPLLFFNYLGVRNIWGKFHAFITIYTILTISCASGLAYSKPKFSRNLVFYTFRKRDFSSFNRFVRIS